MGTGQLKGSAKNAVAEWTKKQCLGRILTTSCLNYELLNSLVNYTSVNHNYISC